MSSPSEQSTIVTTQVLLRPEMATDFLDWQAKLHGIIASFPGFVSLEFLSPTEASQTAWSIIQRFNNSENLSAWRSSKERQELIDALKTFLVKKDAKAIQESESGASSAQHFVTEVFVTQVSPDKENTYHQWLAKIHQAEAKFPGFRGLYVQSPTATQGRDWITFLQFDTQENLDRWVTSSERKELLRELEPLIASIESYRVITPYAGWFSSIAKGGRVPAAWKQTMLVLLVLFPIVMFELKYLHLLTANLNPSLGNFIGNAISVTLIAWPMMPLAIWFLRWWLSPEENKEPRTTLIGTGIVILLYILEIAIFWNFL